MVGPSYLLDKPAPPTALKRYVDQCLFPAAIDAAASVERVVERTAIAARATPWAALGLALIAGWMLAGLIAKPRRTG